MLAEHRMCCIVQADRHSVCNRRPLPRVNDDECDGQCHNRQWTLSKDIPIVYTGRIRLLSHVVTDVDDVGSAMPCAIVPSAPICYQDNTDTRESRRGLCITGHRRNDLLCSPVLRIFTKYPASGYSIDVFAC